MIIRALKLSILLADYIFISKYGNAHRFGTNEIPTLLSFTEKESELRRKYKRCGCCRMQMRPISIICNVGHSAIGTPFCHTDITNLIDISICVNQNGFTSALSTKAAHWFDFKWFDFQREILLSDSFFYQSDCFTVPFR